MAYKTNDLITLIIDGGKKEYVCLNRIDKGSTGTVYLVNDKDSGTNLALKVCDLNDTSQQELFRANAVDMKTTYLDNFIRVHDVGNVSESISNKDSSYPAFVMDYGGSDVNKLYDVLEKVDISVREAVSYKIMYTVISSLENAYSKNKFHGDLLLRNILSGFDINELNTHFVNDREGLNNSLVLGQVRLCDRTISKELGTFALSSLSGKDIHRDFYLLDSLALTEKDKDIYAAMALCSLLLKRENKGKVDKFAESFFGINEFGQSEEGNYITPDLSEIKSKLQEKINYVHEHYFKLMDVVNPSNNELFPVVTRPIDRFNLVWNATKINDLTSLKQFHTDDDAFSYTTLRDCGGNYHTDDEKKLLHTSFSSILEQVVDNTIANLDQNNATLKPLYTTQHTLEKTLKQYDATISSLENELASINTERVASLTKLLTQHDSSEQANFNTIVVQYESKVSTLESTKESRQNDNLSLSTLNEQIQSLENAPYKEMLQYITNNCVGSVTEDCKTRIESKQQKKQQQKTTKK